MESCFIHKCHKRYLCPGGIYIPLLLLIFSSCIDNNTSLCDKNGSQTSAVTVTLTLPGDVHAASMSANDEHTVERLQVLAFREDTHSGEYYYAYAAEGKNFILSDNLLTFEVSLQQYTEKQQFLFLANAQEAVTNSTIQVGMEIEDVISKLIITNATEWQAKNEGVRDWETGVDASSDVIRYIPMYGRTEEIAVIPDIMNTYSLLRMLTRFDIVNITGNFKMVYACLFQWNDQGFLGYNKSNWDTARETVFSVEIPGGTTKTKEPTFYYSADAEGKQITSSIYTFEAAGTTEHLEATALVVGGYYDGDESTLCWYRADIPKFDSQGDAIDGTYGDIVRNNLYMFEIDEVNGPGYPTPPEAYEGGIRINANVKSWNLATQTIILDGQYRFETSHATAHYDREGGTVTIELSTTHPQGLVLGDISGFNWLTVSPLNETGSSITLQVTAVENITGITRSAYIPVKAGNLEYGIKVEQKERRWVQGDQHQIYYKNGREYEIIVQSISPWRLEVIDDHGVLQSYKVTELNENESKIRFVMTDKAYDDLYDAAYFIFHDDNGVYLPAKYPVVSMENDEESPYGPFNSLIVPVGGEIEVHSAFRKARGVWLHGDGVSGLLEELSATATKSMEIVWQDAPEVVTNLTIHKSGTEQAYFKVEGKTPGNAVVALMQEGKIIWSWHIWVVHTNNQPKDLNGWLDRNLGALQTTIGTNSNGNTTSMGLLYQWGRKDPFVVSNQYNVSNSKVARSVYNASGIRITDSQTVESGSPHKLVTGIDNNLKNSIMNPFMFYGGIGTSNNRPDASGYHPVADWYCENAYYVQHKGRFEGQCHNLWNGKAQGKMPFDPCPKGYRIPRLIDWGIDDVNDGVGINNLNLTQFQIWGVISNSYGGNYHKSGWRYSSGDGYANPGIVAYYWSSTDGHKNTNEYNFHSRIIRHTTYTEDKQIVSQQYFDYIQSYGRAHGMSVRCVADDKD